MRTFPQAVTIVTAISRGGPFGVTVSAFSSISLDPPLVLVSLIKGTRAHNILTSAEEFAVSVLSSDQSSLSETFAGRSESQKSPFDDLPFRKGRNGCMVLESGVGYVECRKSGTHDEGDHTLVMGRVTHVKLNRHAPPLVYYNRHYTTVVMPPSGSTTYDSLLAEW